MMFGLLPIAACGTGNRERSAGNDAIAKTKTVPHRGIDPDSIGFVPACDTVSCYLDTAYVHEFPGEGHPVTMKNWILFASAGDSIEIFTGAGTALSTNLGQEHNALRNTAPYFRRRLDADGVVTTWVTMSEGRGDTVEYYFRVRRERAAAATDLAWTGRRARLVFRSRKPSDRFAMVPLSVTERVRYIASWVVDPGTYNVALVHDSLYVICVVPCAKRDTIKLAATSSATWPP